MARCQLRVNKMIIVKNENHSIYIYNEGCKTFEMFDKLFLSVTSFYDAFCDLVDFGISNDLSSFLPVCC